MQRGITGQSANNSLKMSNSMWRSFVTQPLLTSRLRGYVRKKCGKNIKPGGRRQTSGI